MSHSERAHALLSASGAKRWMACTPSARLEDEVPETTSTFAEEGTLAHEIGELMLRHELSMITKQKYKKELAVFQKHELYAEEMLDYCKQYVDLVIERYNAALATTPNAQISIEERLDFSKYVPEGFGTGDVVIIADEYIEVIDLKYGKGVKVEAEGNPQMRLYGLGAYEAYSMLYDFQQIRMTIVQPRLDHFDTDVLEIQELLDWGDDEVRPMAELAAAGVGEFCAGDHCKFCKVRHTCRARAEASLSLEEYDYKIGPLLSVEEIGEILAKAKQLESWASDIQGYALDQAENHGIKYPGWKLVAGKSNRKITDEEAVAASLELDGYNDEQIFNKKMKGITDLEKMLGKKKFEDYIGPYVVKAPGKPALVVETDKRPELNSLDAAERDFG